MTQRKKVDARGSYCPGPLMELIAALKQVGVGDEVEVLSSDKGSATDIPEWVAKVRHEVIGNEMVNGHWSIVVRKLK